MANGKLVLASILAALSLCSCASTVVAVEDRAVRDELELLDWRPAAASDLAGHWRAHRLDGPAAAVLLDLAYWLDADGRFSGAALFAGPPPTYQVLSGAWTLGAGAELQLGEESEPAQAEVAAGLLRLTGSDGSLVLERAEIE